MKLYLIGLPGSGKSFHGKQLADELDLPFIDLDTIIEQETDTSITKLFSEKGEDYFRSLEATVLRQQSKRSVFVMACGGGTPCFHNNMKFINESGKSIFLNTPVSEIAKRLTAEEKNIRPLLADGDPEKPEDKLNALLEERIPFYRQAHITTTGARLVADVNRLLRM